jgi:glycosyltransferase involved in cell wall biosynthesis
MEVRALQQLHVGLMPLRDSEWERGKCSYKMLLYAACGIPSVVSPVGMNAELLGMHPLGLAADGSSEWVEAISALLMSDADADRMGQAGRRLVLDRFDAQNCGRRLGRELRRAAG